jgi:hypothetical protein
MLKPLSLESMPAGAHLFQPKSSDDGGIHIAASRPGRTERADTCRQDEVFCAVKGGRVVRVSFRTFPLSSWVENWKRTMDAVLLLLLQLQGETSSFPQLWFSSSGETLATETGYGFAKVLGFLSSGKS